MRGGVALSGLEEPWARYRGLTAAANDCRPCGARNIRLCCRLARVALAALLLSLASRSLAAEHPAWLTGNAAEQRLASPISGSWTGVPVLQVLQSLGSAERLAIVLDRRVDPHGKVDLSATDERMSVVLQRIAAERGQGASMLDAVTYVGPQPVAERLRTLRAMLHDRARDLPPAARRALVERRAWHWDDLATPRELLADLAREAKVTLEGVDQVPHDLWRGADLPPLAWIDRVLLVAVQFDLSCQFDAAGTTVRLVPLPDHVEVTRSFPGRGQAAALAQKWRKQVPAARITVEGDRVMVAGLVEDQELLEEAQRTGSARRTSVKPGKQVYKLSVDKAPLRSLLAQLGPKLNVEFQWDDAALQQAGRSLDTLVSFKVEDAGLDELLAAVLEPAGLTFKRKDKRVEILPGNKAAQKP